FTEHVLDQQREFTDATIRHITDYFMSLHSVLQSAEQELLTTVKKNYVQQHGATVAVQKELQVAERELQRSIDQLSAYQETPPRQTLLADHIREMKKVLTKVNVTVQYGEPRENPFRFREREPLRKEIHNYFELKCDPNAYHTKMLTYYEPQPFPVLEPINSPEMVHAPPEDEPPSAAGLNHSSSSTNRTLKDMDISNHSSSPLPPATKELTPEDTRATARDHLSLASSGSADRRIRNTPKKNHKKSTPKSADQVVTDETSQQSSTSRRDYPQSKRAYGGRLKSYGSTGSNPNPAHRKSRSTPPADDARRKAQPELNPANPTNAHFLRLTDKVSVTSITTPAKFYVQYEKFSPKNMAEMCKLEAAEDEQAPEQIATGTLYLAQLADEWHRVRVVKSRQSSRKCEVFFVDYGRSEEVAKGSLRALSEEVAGIAAGAEECALYELGPADAGGKWSPEATQIMVDFIDNKQVRMYLVQHDDASRGPMQVDLFVQTIDGYKSLRSTLIYLKLAKPGASSPGQTRRTSGAEAKIKQLQTIQADWVREYRTAIKQRELVRDDVFRARVTHSHSPSEFYVRKNGWQERYGALEVQLAEFCRREESRLAYLPHVGMVCAFEERDVDDVVVWKRGRINKVGEAHCEIFSVDTGHRLVVPWQDIRYLPQTLCFEPAFAVRCTLMHVRPFKQHGYRWTDEAKRYFNRTASASYVFEAFVGDRLPEEEGCYEIVLNIVMKRHDICVNGSMVKEGFAVSSGSESAVVERIKEVIPEEEDEVVGVEAAAAEQKSSVEEAGNRTLGSRSATSEGQQRTKSRLAVSILRLVDPGEFYVTLQQHANGIERMQEEIQNVMEDKEPGDKTDWKKGEYCLVFPTVVSKRPDENGHIACEYYRAQVIDDLDDSTFTVFLIDKAITMNIHYSNMAVIAPTLRQIHPAAIRCFLACVGPIGNQQTWSSSVIDAFKVTCGKFKRFSISLHGPSVHGALPVILWGMTEEKVKALSPQMYLYTNINNRLGQYGYVHLKEKFKPLAEAASIEEELQRYHQSFDKFLEELDVDMKEEKPDPQQQEDDSLTHSCGTYQDDITDEHTPIDRWLPAKPIDKTIFVGKPSYVDNNGVIYLHDMEQEPVLNALRKVINAKFADSSATDKFYSDNEPCMAKFHQDNKFYRAIVRKAISCRRYKVQFIDYGNIEEVDIADLRKNVICGRVPIQMNRYRLTNVAPKEGNTWPTEVLDTLHSLIVDKQCQIRVDTDMDTDAAGVVPCFMKTTGVVCVDVSDYLLEKEMVVKKFAVALEERVDPLYDPYMNLHGTARKGVAPPGRPGLKIGANFGVDIMSTESGESGGPTRAGNFSQKELDDLFQHLATEQSRLDNAELEDGEDSDDELNRVQYFDTYDNIKQEFDSAEEADSIALSPGGGTGTADRADDNSRLSFDPNEFDTSTQIDPPLELTRPTEHGYPQFELDESCKGFYCEVTNLADTFNLFVFPQLESHIQRMKELMAKIQCYARKHRKCVDIEEDMPCLALFKADHFWYRGVIKEFNPATNQVQIFYVDYLNSETVSVRDILKCPVNLRRVPLRNVQIRLHGIRGNPRMRDADIRRKLVELIEGKRLYAKVTAHKPVLEVELYTDSKCTSLVYHRLIREKYFEVKEGSEPTTAAFKAVRRRDK
ncbi:hypothetical protein pipiens_008146, partial [Culex pipiens pipiens]